jgi:nickel/cobalt transporter (NicO) family protein
MPAEPSTLALWSFGFLLGLRHAFEPDHVAAIGTLVRCESCLRRALGIGLAWGSGHALTTGLGIVLVASAPSSLEHAGSDLLQAPAAVLMIGFGAWCVGDGVRILRCPRHARAAGEPAAPPRSPWRGFLVGAAHGLAGSGLVTMIAAGALPSLAAALAYGAVASLGSIAGMAAMTLALAMPFLAAGRGSLAHAVLGTTCGLASVAIGLTMVDEILPAARELPRLLGGGTAA